LWEITKTGQKTSYLYGTMHVSRKLAFNLSDTFYLALQKSDVIALELDPQTWMTEMHKAGDFLSKDPRYQSNIGNVYAAFEWQKIEQEVYEYVLSKGHNFANALLYRNSDETDFEENTYLDMFIYQAAQKWNKKLVGLEDYAFVEECEYYGKQSKPGKYSGGHYSSREEIEKAYRKGDLSALDSINTILFESNYFREYMLDKRNRIMAIRMDSIMRSGYSLFTGVGAAHLPGAVGVIELLRAQGYTVRPINAFHSDFSTQMREQLEKTFAPIDYSPVVSPDSLFKIDLPGALYVIQNRKNVTEYFYPEMKNGTYYSITKIQTYAWAFQQSIDEQTKMFENILYEYIPGKILNKKIEKRDGVAIIQITNETRKGDIQRYKIYILPNEVLVGKMAGTGMFAQGKDGERFIESFHPILRKAPSLLHLPRIEVNMGEGQLSESFSLIPYTFQSQAKIELQKENDHTFLLSTSYVDFEYIEEDTFELQHIIERFAIGIEGVIASSSFTTIHQRPSILASIELKNKKTMLVQSYIQGPHYFLVGSTKASSAELEAICNSIRIKYIDISEKVTVSDTAFFFQAKSSAVVAAANGKKYTIAPDINKSPTESYNGTIIENIYHADPSGTEKIEIYYKQYNPYTSFKSLDAYWNETIERIRKRGLIVHQHDTTNGKYPTLLVELRDTNSMRCIYWKYFLVKASFYCLSYNSDTLIGLTPFAKNYFDSFTITKELTNRSLFEPQLHQFYFDLLQGDSLQSIGAYKSIPSILFKSKDIDSIVYLIDNESKYPKYLRGYKVKYRLIETLGRVSDDKVIGHLEKLYLQYPDSMQIQARVLQALSYHKTATSFKKLNDLLSKDNPYLDYSDLSNLFHSFYDSLELCSSMFPALLDLTRYSGYKTQVYKLMAALWEKGLLKKSILQQHKKYLVLDAQDEVKSKLGSSRSSSNGSAYYDFKKKSTIPNYDLLESYIILLMPFQKESNVHAFYERVRRIKEPTSQLRYSILLHKLNYPISDTLFAYYNKQVAYRATLYRGLSYSNRLSEFDTLYCSPDSMAKALLYRNALSSLQKDSIVFYQKVYAELRGSQKGYVYFYKRYVKDSRKWYLDYVGLIPEVGAPVNVFPMNTSRYNSIKNPSEKEFKKSVESVVNEFKLYQRERAKNRYDYTYDDDMEF
jgi:uncharacterized protein YbaP (TraB family)